MARLTTAFRVQYFHKFPTFSFKLLTYIPDPTFTHYNNVLKEEITFTVCVKYI